MITDETANLSKQNEETFSEMSMDKALAMNNNENSNGNNVLNNADNFNDNEEIVLENEDQLQELSLEELRNICLKKNRQISYLKEQNSTLLKSKKELENIHNNCENKLKQQQLESIRKHNTLIMRLTHKDQELQECLGQIEALKNSKLPLNQQLGSYLLDPALNYVFDKMKKEVDMAKSRVEEMQNDMNAWKFSSDSITGKQLMARCRQLHQENEDLGQMICSGKLAKLEGASAMYKTYSESLHSKHTELEDIFADIEENAEGLQNTIFYLQEKLKKYEEAFQNCKCNIKDNEIKNETIEV